MSDAAEFFLGSAPSVARLDTLEISHPNFSRTYRIVRNAPGGLLTASGGVEWVFDGVNDEVAMGDVLDKDHTEAFSVFVWVGTNSTGTQSAISKAAANNVEGWRVLINGAAVGHTTPTGAIYCGLIGDHLDALQVVSDVTLPDDGSVHFVGFTKSASPSASGLKIYIDGVAVAMTVQSDDLDSSMQNAASLKIGARGSTLFLDGSANDGSVWNRVLTPSEVAEIYNGGNPPDLNAVSCASALEGWWKLDEEDTEATDGIVDHSGNGLNGTANFSPSLGTGPASYEYYPARVLPIASEDDLVQSLSISLGDVGDVIAAELVNVWAANGMDTRPTLTYRAYRSDDLSAPIEGSTRVLEIASVSRSKEGATFEARAPELNANRTGRLYTVETFPMLEGFQ